MIYVKNYMSLKELLSSKYGPAQLDEKKWINSLYMDKPERHGFAILIGHLSYRSKWTTARDNIVLKLTSDNYNMLLEAVYSSR